MRDYYHLQLGLADSGLFKERFERLRDRSSLLSLILEFLLDIASWNLRFSSLFRSKSFISSSLLCL